MWNLLPNEHAAAWAPDLSGGPASPSTVVSVRFFDTVVRGGRTELVAVAHWNKLLKGALVAHVVAEQLTDPDGLADFDHPLGYRFDPTAPSAPPTASPSPSASSSPPLSLDPAELDRTGSHDRDPGVPR